jgi:hypothetical protein
MDAEALSDEVLEVLELNGAYYNHGSDGWERYAPAPELLEALGIFVTSVALPILTNVVSSQIQDRLSRKRRSKEEDLADVRKSIAAAHHKTKPAELSHTIEVVREILIQYGWPPAEATADAERIVRRMIEDVWPEE